MHAAFVVSDRQGARVVTVIRQGGALLVLPRKFGQRLTLRDLDVLRPRSFLPKGKLGQICYRVLQRVNQRSHVVASHAELAHQRPRIFVGHVRQPVDHDRAGLILLDGHLDFGAYRIGRPQPRVDAHHAALGNPAFGNEDRQCLLPGFDPSVETQDTSSHRRFPGCALLGCARLRTGAVAVRQKSPGG